MKENTTTTTPHPVACLLTDREMAERKVHLTHTLFAHLQTIDDLPDGLAFTFAFSDGLMDELARFIAFERGCCPFLTFTVVVEADSDVAVLRLTGPEGTREALRADVETMPGVREKLPDASDGANGACGA